MRFWYRIKQKISLTGEIYHGKVITFGELMLRLQPFNYERFVQASTFEATFGGGSGRVQR